MQRLLSIILSPGPFISLSFIIFYIILLILRKRLNKKTIRIISFIPLLISVVHYIVYYTPDNFIAGKCIYMYIFALLIAILPFLNNKKKIYKVLSIILIPLGLFSFFLTTYSNISIESIHSLTYYSYTKSFTKTIDILKKEYVLNEHKKIDYDYLYNKYYPLIEIAEKDKDEQLFFKTMYEFANNFRDCHFSFGIIDSTFEKTVRKYAFVNDYSNKNYGFGSILLSDGQVIAVMVDQNSEAYQKGLRDGMTITKKDNTNVSELIKNVIKPIDSYPVLEDELLFNSLYLFATGDEYIDITFINDNNEYVTIQVHEIDEYNERPEDLFWKIMYYDEEAENLETKMLDDNTGYIYISDEQYSPLGATIGYIFDDSSYLTKIVDKKLEELKSNGMENLIIDLRSNSGGYLTESEAIASLFTKDNYMVSKFAKYNSNNFSKSYLKGNGRYSDMKIIVLVNSDTASAGDALTYMFSKMDNASIMGFTNSNHSCQSVGGFILLSGGAYIAYPIYRNYDENNNIFIDTDYTGKATIEMDNRIPLTKETVMKLINTEEDYLINYALQLID